MEMSGNDASQVDVLLSRAAYDVLKSKNLVPQDTELTRRKEEKVVVKRITIQQHNRPDVYGKRICFEGGERVAIDESNVVISIESDTNVVRLDEHLKEKLNIAEQLDMVAFPVHRPELELADANEVAAKRARIDSRPNIFASLPDECALLIISFAKSMQDILPLMSVCKRWFSLLSRNRLADTTIWKPLCLQYYPILEPIREVLEDTTVSWQNLFLTRALCLKKRFRQKDFADRFDHMDNHGAFVPFLLYEYKNSFSIYLWKEDGSFQRVKVKPDLHSSDNKICLKLPIGFQMIPEQYVSLDVCIQHVGESLRYTLYSGAIIRSENGLTFAPFNQFEKFHGKSFFVGARPARDDGPDYEYAPISIPSIEASFVVIVGSPIVEIKLSWQVEKDGTCVPMSRQDALIFFQKGMVAKTAARRPCSPPTSMFVTTFSPRELNSYGFLVDFRGRVEESLPRLSNIVSRYYEPSEVISDSDGYFSFKLDVPSECQDMIPGTNFDEREIDVAIYVLDKISGRMAMLYEGCDNGWDHDWDTGELFHVMSEKEDFETFDASTFFSVRSPLSSHYGTSASVGATLHVPDHSPALFEVTLNWLYLKTCSEIHSVSLRKEDITTFFEKVLMWGN